MHWNNTRCYRRVGPAAIICILEESNTILWSDVNIESFEWLAIVVRLFPSNNNTTCRWINASLKRSHLIGNACCLYVRNTWKRSPAEVIFSSNSELVSLTTNNIACQNELGQNCTWQHSIQVCPKIVVVPLEIVRRNWGISILGTNQSNPINYNFILRCLSVSSYWSHRKWFSLDSACTGGRTTKGTVTSHVVSSCSEQRKLEEFPTVRCSKFSHWNLASKVLSNTYIVVIVINSRKDLCLVGNNWLIVIWWSWPI